MTEVLADFQPTLTRCDRPAGRDVMFSSVVVSARREAPGSWMDIIERPDWLMVTVFLLVGAMALGGFALWWHRHRRRGTQAALTPMHGLPMSLNRLHELTASPPSDTDSEASLLDGSSRRVGSSRRSRQEKPKRPSLRGGWGAEETVRYAELHRPSSYPDAAPDEEEIRRAAWNFRWSILLRRAPT